MINITDLDLDDILLDEKSYENHITYVVTYKTPYGAKSLHINFDIDGCISAKFEKTFNRIRYLIGKNAKYKYIRKSTLIQMMICL